MAFPRFLLAMLLMAAAATLRGQESLSYSFEGECTATQFLDDAEGYAGTLENGARVVAMSDGNHALYTGLSDGYADLGAAVGSAVVGKLDGDFSVSVDVMVQAEDNALGQNGNFVWVSASQLPNGSPRDYAMLRVRDGAMGYTLRYGSENHRVESTSQLPTGGWHNLAYVHEGEEARLYLDGQLLAAQTYGEGGGEEAFLSPADVYAHAGQLDYNYLGRSSWSGDAYLRNALIDNFQIVPRALSAAEVSAGAARAASASAQSAEKLVVHPSDTIDFDTQAGIDTLIYKVNTTWQARMGAHHSSFWNRAVYETGNMAAYAYLGTPAFRDFAMEWGAYNDWQGSKGDDPSQWKYTYGEGDGYALFGDWQCCFQTYIDLFLAQREEERDSALVRRALQVMDYMAESDTVDYWWWADALFMAMPVLPRMYALTGEAKYLDKLYDCFRYSRQLMYDEERHLFFRDANYLYPQHQTSHGLPDFWSRGNGWVVAGLSQVLRDTPPDWEHRDYFLQIYRDLCASVIACQTGEGYWTESLQDTLYATCRESSGTALFTFGLLWGVNNGLLDGDSYLPPARRAWHYLTRTALQPSWLVGYMQPIGAAANEGASLSGSDVADFGTGAFLLAAVEMGRHVAARDADAIGDVRPDTPSRGTDPPTAAPSPRPAASPVYAPSGERLAHPRRGLNIVGGKKVWMP